jgi:uncharacterized protein (DUF736 family)
VTPRNDGPRIELRSELARFDETVALVNEVFAGFEAPPGWRVLRASGHLEAEWRDREHWARFSVRFSPPQANEGVQAALLERDVGEGTVSVVFTCSDLEAATMSAASELLTPLQRLVARAAAR